MLVMRNIAVFYLQRVALYFRGMRNSIDFYSSIFINIVPACIIVPYNNAICLMQFASLPKRFSVSSMT